VPPLQPPVCDDVDVSVSQAAVMTASNSARVAPSRASLRSCPEQTVTALGGDPQGYERR
jgi:hypothetical protein